jgi:hypothetical protein
MGDLDNNLVAYLTGRDHLVNTEMDGRKMLKCVLVITLRKSRMHSTTSKIIQLQNLMKILANKWEASY